MLYKISLIGFYPQLKQCFVAPLKKYLNDKSGLMISGLCFHRSLISFVKEVDRISTKYDGN